MKIPLISMTVCVLFVGFISRGQSPSQSSPRQDREFGLSNPLPRTKGAIRLATYNVLNLFDHADDPALSGEFDDKKFPTSTERCQALAKAIKTTNADVLALQEVESLEALTWFRDTFLSDAGYNYLASIDVGYYRGVECSVMSRFPILETRVWTDADLNDVDRSGSGWASVPVGKKLKYQRSPLMVTIQTDGGYELTIFSVHHKAGKDYNYLREAEALKTIEIINHIQAEEPARNIIIMGDFNGAPWNKSVRAYRQAGMIDAMSHRDIPPAHLPQQEALQYKTHESGRVIDYILLNSAAHRELVIGSAHVYGTGAPPRDYDWRNDPYPPGYASDHYPVIIDLIPKDKP